MIKFHNVPRAFRSYEINARSIPLDELHTGGTGGRLLAQAFADPMPETSETVRGSTTSVSGTVARSVATEPQSVVRSVTDSVTGPVTESVSEFLARTVAGTSTASVTGAVAESAAGAVTESVAGAVAGAVAESVTDAITSSHAPLYLEHLKDKASSTALKRAVRASAAAMEAVFESIAAEDAVTTASLALEAADKHAHGMLLAATKAKELEAAELAAAIASSTLPDNVEADAESDLFQQNVKDRVALDARCNPQQPYAKSSRFIKISNRPRIASPPSPRKTVDLPTPLDLSPIIVVSDSDVTLAYSHDDVIVISDDEDVENSPPKTSNLPPRVSIHNRTLHPFVLPPTSAPLKKRFSMNATPPLPVHSCKNRLPTPHIVIPLSSLKSFREGSPLSDGKKRPVESPLATSLTETPPTKIRKV